MVEVAEREGSTTGSETEHGPATPDLARAISYPSQSFLTQLREGGDRGDTDVHSLPAPAPAPARLGKLITVRAGDTLERLARRAYGRVDDEILKHVQKHNPAVTDLDLILVGQIILFPPLPGLE